MPTVNPIPALDRTAPTFKTDVDTYFGTQIPAFSVEVETLRVEVLSNSTTATTAASTATTKAAESAASALASLNSENNAVAAAIAAQTAAGLPTLPNGGQLLKTAGVLNILTTNTTAVANTSYEVNTTSGAVTVTLPLAPNVGDWVYLADYLGTFGTNALTVARNGKPIMGLAEDMTVNSPWVSITLYYANATKGWAIR